MGKIKVFKAKTFVYLIIGLHFIKMKSFSPMCENLFIFVKWKKMVK